MLKGAVKMSLNSLCWYRGFISNVKKENTYFGTRQNPSVSIRVCCVLVEESGHVPAPKKVVGKRRETQTTCIFPGKSDVVGIIGGVSISSTLVFLEKLVWWSSRNRRPFPFILCSDPTICVDFASHSPQSGYQGKCAKGCSIIENLRQKRAFLEQSGVGCLVMPCNISHVWHKELSDGCCVPFLNLGDCVTRELIEAKLKPLEVGGKVRIGILSPEAAQMAGIYQDKLHEQGFEVVLPDIPTMDHILLPAIGALGQKDIQGAQTLLRIAIQALMVKAVNIVILASDEFQGLLPVDDPLLKKCINPMDALARSTIEWACTTQKIM